MGAGVTRRNGGYLDGGRGTVRASWRLLTRVWDEVRHGFTVSRVIVPTFGTALFIVLPVTATTGSLTATLTAMAAVYPFCHLYFRYRARHGIGSNVGHHSGDR